MDGELQTSSFALRIGAAAGRDLGQWPSGGRAAGAVRHPQPSPARGQPLPALRPARSRQDIRRAGHGLGRGLRNELSRLAGEPQLSRRLCRRRDGRGRHEEARGGVRRATRQPRVHSQRPRRRTIPPRSGGIRRPGKPLEGVRQDLAGPARDRQPVEPGGLPHARSRPVDEDATVLPRCCAGSARR